MTIITFRCTQQGMGSCRGWGWHVQSHHRPTGSPWAEEYCPWFPTRAEAEAGAAEALYVQELQAEARATAAAAEALYIQELQAEARERYL